MCLFGGLSLHLAKDEIFTCFVGFRRLAAGWGGRGTVFLPPLVDGPPELAAGGQLGLDWAFLIYAVPEPSTTAGAS